MAEEVMTELVKHQTPKEKEAEGLRKEAAQSAKAAEARQELDNLSKALAHVEAQSLSGAPELTPKEIMLDLSDLKAKHPDKHFRWVNIKAPGVAERRRLDGYLRLPESEGGRELGGEVAVFVTTERLHEHRVAQIEKLTKDRLSAHRAEVEQAAEAVARELRDKHGLRVDVGRLLVDEE